MIRMRLLSKKININLKFYILIVIFFLFIIPSNKLTAPVLEEEGNIENGAKEINTSIKNSISAVQPLTLVTPESKNYDTPMSGYYPGTFAFENHIHGTTGTNIDFIDEYYDITGGDFVDIVIWQGPFDGHNNYLGVRDAQGGTYTWGVHHFNPTPVSGTIEFLQHTTGTTGIQYFELRAADDTTAIEIRYNLVAGKYQYFDGSSWLDMADLFIDSWVHHSITFDCNAGVNGQYTWIISYKNGTEIGRVDNLEFLNNLNSIEELYVGTDTGSYLIGTQYDAFGFSWDPNYKLGDNRKEGLLIGFDSSTSYDWIGYSLDGKNNITIQGNKTIAMPLIGSHTIQVFANDSLGDWYVSDLRAFQTNYLEDHLPISIDGNADFATQASNEGWSGDGSQNNPYIIKDYNINGSTLESLSIYNTDVYFNLQNVFVNNSGTHGIKLSNVTNAELINNIVIDSTYDGFGLSGSINNTFTNNTATGNGQNGFYLDNSDYNILTNNTAISNIDDGFYLYYSDSNTLTNNTATINGDDGFYLAYSDPNTLTNNTAISNDNDGFYFVNSNSLTLIRNTAHSNAHWGFYLSFSSGNTMVNNIAISNARGYLLMNSNSNIITNNTAVNCDIGFNVASSSSNNIMINNTVIGNNIGIYLSGLAGSNTLTSNTAINNAQIGFRFYDSSSNTLAYNIAIGNGEDGFYFTRSGSNTLTNNNASSNSGIGFRFDNSNSNNITSNFAISNGKDGFSVLSFSFNTLVNNTIIGNTEMGFRFDSSNNNTLTGNLVTFNDLSGIKLFTSSNNSFNLNNLDNNQEYGIWLDTSSSLNKVNENTIIFNNLGDIKDDGTSNTFLDNIISTSPVISSPSDFSIYYGDTGYSILWTVTDNNPANYTVYDNGTVFDTNIWTDFVLIWLDGLEVGLHNFTCVVQNSYGRTASDQVMITVLPAVPDTTPPTISSPADFSFEEGSIGYSIEWIGSDAYPWWASVWRNNTLIYDQSWTPLSNKIIINLDGFNAGPYNFTCSFFDEAGNFVSDTVLITVEVAVPDTESPIITPPSPFTYEEGATGLMLTWNCSDAHPYAYQITINSIGFPDHEYNPWHGENISISIDGLEIGVWVLNLTLWDLFGNNASNEVIVEVIPEALDTIPPFASQPTDLIVSENMAGTIIWEVDDEHPHNYTIRKNGTQLFEPDLWISGIIQYHFSSLPLGTWEFELTVWDEAGNNVSSITFVNVLPGNLYDAQPPEISQIPDQTFTYGSIGNSVVVYLFDQHPQGYSVFILGATKDPIETPWTIPNIQFELSLKGLGMGNYVVNISAWDVYNNFNSRTFTVTVTGDSTPPTIDFLPDITTYSSISVNLNWVVLDDVSLSYFEFFNLNAEQLIMNDTITGNRIEIVLGTLEIGIHDFRILIYDSSGNFAIDDVTITVIEGEPSSIEISTSPGFDFFSIFSILLFVIISNKAINNKRRSMK